MTVSIAADAIVPCVSVIVTTYNRAGFLAQTVDSILGQSYRDFELIVVDNMSTDSTQDFVTCHNDPRIFYYRNPNNGVIAVNRNYGIQRARGKYIAFCDDDDLWTVDKLQMQVTLLESQPELALCYTNAEAFVGDRVLKRKMIRRIVDRNHFFQLLRGNYIPNSSVFLRACVFREIGLLTTDPMLREDYEMWLRVARNYSIAGFDKALIRYRVHLSNMAGNRATETIRAIRTVRHVAKRLNIPWWLVFPNILFQSLKYIAYRISPR